MLQEQKKTSGHAISHVHNKKSKTSPKDDIARRCISVKLYVNES
jgi:hypothetical protein